jgi:hypothetical protein
MKRPHKQLQTQIPFGNDKQRETSILFVIPQRIRVSLEAQQP